MDVIYTTLYDEATRIVTLVSIPKLKPQAIVPASTSRKKVEKKKSEVKTKKVATSGCGHYCTSVSFLGVLFFMLLFGGLVPLSKVDMEV